MADGVHSSTGNLLQASDLALTLVLKQAPNSIRYTTFGDTKLSDPELDRIVQAVPAVVAAAMSGRAFYFVPLALAEGFSEARGDSHRSASDRTLVSPIYNAELSDEAICHRNVAVPSSGAEPAHEGIFISARLLRDTFALAFEYFINVGHAFATEVGIPEAFGTLAWQQAVADVRGETSQDAWESRNQALNGGAPHLVSDKSDRAQSDRSIPDRSRPDKSRPDEKAKLEFIESAFADAIAIYLLSLAVDFDYSELREREYPLLAPSALAERLRLVAHLFPPNPGYEFSIRYRRRA
jgi:hypothetical protein